MVTVTLPVKRLEKISLGLNVLSLVLVPLTQEFTLMLLPLWGIFSLGVLVWYLKHIPGVLSLAANHYIVDRTSQVWEILPDMRMSVYIVTAVSFLSVMGRVLVLLIS